jgi:hypothetical protein
MPIEQIVAFLIEERDKLNAAIRALGGVEHDRPVPMKPRVSGGNETRHVSAAARRKMAAAQKRRWAKIKAAK